MGDYTKPTGKMMTALQEFEDLQDELRAFGANDTEPRGELWHRIRTVVTTGDVFPVPDVEEERFERWQLYSSMDSWKVAAERLEGAWAKLEIAIMGDTFPNVKRVLQWYGMDV